MKIPVGLKETNVGKLWITVYHTQTSALLLIETMCFLLLRGIHFMTASKSFPKKMWNVVVMYILLDNGNSYLVSS